MEQSKVYSAVLLQSEYPPSAEVETAIREEARAALNARGLEIESEAEWAFSGPEEDGEEEEDGLYVKLFHGRPKA